MKRSPIPSRRGGPWIAGACALVLACRTAALRPSEPLRATHPSVAPASAVSPGIDLSAMDPAVSACDDFYEYACGAWNRVPPRADRSFEWRGAMMADADDVAEEAVLAAAAEGHPLPGTVAPKLLGDVWASCLDEQAVDADLATFREWIGRFAEEPDLALAVAHLHARGANPFFTFGVQPDLRGAFGRWTAAGDVPTHLASLSRGGMWFHNPLDYGDASPQISSALAAYRAELVEDFEALGETAGDAARDADADLLVEASLARPAAPLFATDDPSFSFDVIHRSDLSRIAPSFPWETYFHEIGARPFDELVIQRRYLEHFDQIWRDTPPSQLRAYLRAQALIGLREALPARFRHAAFTYLQRVHGEETPRSRAETCLRLARSTVNSPLAQSFMAQRFTSERRALVVSMLGNIAAVLDEDFAKVGWMDAWTQAHARWRLRALQPQIGGPTEWPEVFGIESDRRSLLATVIQARTFAVKQQLQQIGTPVRSGEWSVSPLTVNAFAQRRGELVLPAAFLQPPLVEPGAEWASYGGLGAIVGHELTHEFESAGELVDGVGIQHDWRSVETQRAFNERAACVRSAYEGLSAAGVRLSSGRTLNENVADLGGLRLAYLAMERARAARPAKTGGRFTAEQQFFIGFAQTQCTRERPLQAERDVRYERHSPGELRVNIPVSEMPEFARAFGCPATAKLVRPSASVCRIW